MLNWWENTHDGEKIPTMMMKITLLKDLEGFSLKVNV